MAAAGGRRPSTFALVGRTGKGNVRRRRDGDVWGATSDGRVHMYGARVRPVRPPHRAARQDRARRARPRRRIRHPPARPADERLADRDLRSRRAVLAGTVRRVGGPDHEPMPAGRDRPTGQARPRRVHRARRTGRRRWRSGSDHRRDARHSAFLPGGEAARPWDAATGALVRRPRRRRSCDPPSPAIAAPAVPGVVSMSVPPPPNGVRGATRAMGRHGRRVARADETRDRRPDVGLRASLRQMVTP